MKCEWISVADRLPQDGAPVLAVKQLKNKRLEVCLARCIPDYEHYDYETKKNVKAPYWVCGGNNNVIFWMPLPDLPDPPALVIAGNEETGEEYLAELLDADPRGHDPAPNPIVRILRVVRYPNQRAIAHPETAMEFPAVEFGTILRMEALRQPSPMQGQEYTKAAYDESLRAAITQALRDARTEEERAILRRHLSGDFRRKRVFIRFTEQNWLRIEATEGDFHRADG